MKLKTMKITDDGLVFLRPLMNGEEQLVKLPAITKQAVAEIGSKEFARQANIIMDKIRSAVPVPDESEPGAESRNAIRLWALWFHLTACLSDYTPVDEVNHK